MAAIGKGDEDAQNTFLKKIDGWANNHAKRIAKRVYGNDAVDAATVEEVTNEILFDMISETQNPRHFKQDPLSWSNFNHDFQRLFQRRLEMQRDGSQNAYAFRQQLTPDASDPDYMPDVAEVVSGKQRDAAVRAWVDSLRPRQAQVVRQRYLDDTRTGENIGEELGVGRERIYQIEGKALTKLRRTAHRLGDFYEDANPDQPGSGRG